MKRTGNHNQEIFKGIGHLIGYCSALVLALVVYVLSKNVVAAIVAFVPFGITAGILFEQRFQDRQEQFNPKSIRTSIGLFFVGVIVFLFLFFLVKY